MGSKRILSRLGCVVAALALIAVSCGEDGGDAATTTEPTVTSSTTTTVATTTTSSAAPTTSQATTTTAPITTTTLAGQVIDFGPAAGDRLAVLGVAEDDVLNVREGPGVDYDIITTFDPLADGVIAGGETRTRNGSAWYQVLIDGRLGWVNSSFLAFAGATDDITSSVVDRLGGIPEADDMTELGLIVAESQASEDPASRIVISVAPTSGDLGEITYDVVGLGDDAVFGLRLHVFGQPSNGGFSLKSVEATVMCSRGVTDDGLCI